MSHPIAISDTSFENEVANADKPVLVDFWAEWCGPCRMIAPVLETLAEEYSDSLKIAKLDVDRNPQTMMKFGVQSIPTLILFRDGAELERIVGFIPRGQLVERLMRHLNYGKCRPI